MKKILKYTLLFTFALITYRYLWGNIEFTNQPGSIVLVGLILAFFEIILKPIIKLLLLPINILTLGLIRFIIDTLGLYLAIFLIGDFSLNSVGSSGTLWQSYGLPPFQFSGIASYIFTSINIGIIMGIFKTLVKNK